MKHVCPTCGALMLFEQELKGTITELYEGWLSDLTEEGRSRFYVVQLRQRFVKYIIPALGKLRPQDIKTKALVQLKRSLFSNGLAPKTVKHVLAALSSFLNHLATTGELEAVPVFPKLKVTDSRPKAWLAPALQERIVEAADSADRLIFRTMFETGCRVSEACALPCGALMDGGIRIARAFDDYGALKSTKTGTSSFKALSQALFQALLFSCRAFDPGQFLFLRDGKPYSRRKLRYRWQVACRRAGVPLIPLSQATRHSRASQARADIEGRAQIELKAVLGHSEATTTLKHYALDAGKEVKPCLNVLRPTAR